MLPHTLALALALAPPTHTRMQQPNAASRRRGRSAPKQGFSSYICKAHKKKHGGGRSVSTTAMAVVDQLVDEILAKFINNSKLAMAYSCGGTLNRRVATSAVTLSLSGLLQAGALEAGNKAVSAFEGFPAAGAAAAEA